MGDPGISVIMKSSLAIYSPSQEAGGEIMMKHNKINRPSGLSITLHSIPEFRSFEVGKPLQLGYVPAQQNTLTFNTRVELRVPIPRVVSSSELDLGGNESRVSGYVL